MSRAVPRIARATPALAALMVLAVAAIAAGCGQPQTGATTSAYTAPLASGAVTAAATTPASARPFQPLSWPASLPRPARVLRVPVMMYHHVGNPPPGADRIRRGLTLSAAHLEAQMAWLSQAGGQPITQAQLFKALMYGAPLPAHPVLLTFDDGYADNYTVALPILRRYGFPATFFIISGMVGQPDYMSWDQIVALDREGMDIGSHTVDHADLTIVSAANRKSELRGSAAAIAAHVGHPVYWFCYPSGKLNQQVVTDVMDAGYLLATTERFGGQQSSDAALTLCRYRISNETTLETFKELVR